MAAKAGQILQAELLVVYGADPGAPDINGRTPMDYARYERARGQSERTRLGVFSLISFVFAEGRHSAWFQL